MLGSLFLGTWTIFTLLCLYSQLIDILMSGLELSPKSHTRMPERTMPMRCRGESCSRIPEPHSFSSYVYCLKEGCFCPLQVKTPDPKQSTYILSTVSITDQRVLLKPTQKVGTCLHLLRYLANPSPMDQDGTSFLCQSPQFSPHNVKRASESSNQGWGSRCPITLMGSIFLEVKFEILRGHIQFFSAITFLVHFLLLQ